MSDLRLRFPQQSDALSVILKLPGETCNINCRYCYEKRKPYPNARQLTPEILRTFLALCDSRALRIELHGGEPLLMRRPRMARLLEELRAYPGPVSLGIQTNGLLLDDAWIDFFLREWPTIDIGVSLDGDPAANRHRVDYHDADTTARVEEALRGLHRSSVGVGVIAAVTRLSLGRGEELIRYFSTFPAIQYLKFAPCLDFNVKTKRFPKHNRSALVALNGTGTGQPGWATSPLEYADFVIEAFEAWKLGPYRQFVVEPIHSVIQVLAGKRPAFCHFSETKCAHILTLYPDGRLGSCDELPMPLALLAHVDALDTIEPVLQMRSNTSLAGRLDALFDKCNACDYRPTCRGGCLATRLRYQGTELDDEYCRYRMRLVDYVRDALSPAPSINLT